jgi:hypothetical protein
VQLSRALLLLYKLFFPQTFPFATISHTTVAFATVEVSTVARAPGVGAIGRDCCCG